MFIELKESLNVLFIRRFSIFFLLFLAMYPRFVWGFCRTTSDSADTVARSTKCITTGYPLYWKNECIGFRVATEASRFIDYESTVSIATEAFGAWTKVACGDGNNPSLRVSFLGKASRSEAEFNQDGNNQNVILYRDDNWPYEDNSPTIALTTLTLNSEDGEILDADIEVNSKNFHVYKRSDLPIYSGYDLYTIFAHESGHFYGLAHSGDKTATMYGSYQEGTTSQGTLKQDDISGICSAYVAGPSRSISTNGISANATTPASRCDPHDSERSYVGGNSKTAGSCSCHLDVHDDGFSSKKMGLAALFIGLFVMGYVRKSGNAYCGSSNVRSPFSKNRR